MKVNSATISKTGRRTNNEDAFCVIDEQTEGRWFGIVCDGMSGHAMGEVASETVVKAVSESKLSKVLKKAMGQTLAFSRMGWQR